MDKVVAVVESQYPDNGRPLTKPGPVEQKIAEHIIEFLEHEVSYGRMPENLLPLQSGGMWLRTLDSKFPLCLRSIPRAQRNRLWGPEFMETPLKPAWKHLLDLT